MKIIPLTQGMVALIDDEDFEVVNRWTWYANLCGNRYYAASSETMSSGRLRHFQMHRLLMGATEGQYVDHRDRNSLDNRRTNLRFCTNSQNLMNRGIDGKNTSGFKGVGFLKQKPDVNRWRAYVQVDSKFKHLGYFPTALQAANAYDEAALIHYGEFALTNRQLGLVPRNR